MAAKGAAGGFVVTSGRFTDGNSRFERCRAVLPRVREAYGEAQCETRRRRRQRFLGLLRLPGLQRDAIDGLIAMNPVDGGFVPFVG
jgi:hypothetical protein